MLKRLNFDNLVRLGISNSQAWAFANTRKGYWHIANGLILTRTLINEFFRNHGLHGLSEVYAKSLSLEPPYAERHVQWCERTVRELIPHFLLPNKLLF